jgi:NADH-quinone oxidoreductase subunit B
MDEGLKSELQKQGVFTMTLEELYNWGRKNSVWPLQFGLACCAIEMIAASMARYDSRDSARKCFVLHPARRI